MNTLRPIILCGGSGTRLWPLSRQTLPKQFVPLLDNKSLLQLTLERLRLLNPEITCVAAEAHRFLVQDAVEAAQVGGVQVLEPVQRNTAAAMATAALLAEPDQLLLFAPADHHIPDAQAFAATVHRAMKAAQAGFIVTFGVVPTFPSAAYGYIRQGEALDGGPDAGWRAAAFVEKPTIEHATQLVLRGDHFWNAGIFLIQAQVLIDALAEHASDILEACRQATAHPVVDGAFIRIDRAAFEACRSQSIDYAVLEKSNHVAVFPFHGTWSDVGSWNAVAALHSGDDQGNRIHGQGYLIGARNTFAHAPTRPVVVLGTQDLLIVDTPDAVLVTHKDFTEEVKSAVSLLTMQGHHQATRHRRMPRPWGSYDNVEVSERFAIKRLTVKPGAMLALRMHHHRAEHWVVVQGVAQVIRDGEMMVVRENESMYIPRGTAYQLGNPGPGVLEIIEVQSGSHLDEDDTVRFNEADARIEASTRKLA